MVSSRLDLSSPALFRRFTVLVLLVALLFSLVPQVKAADTPVSDNSDLGNLVLSGAVLYPSFNPTELNYTATAPNTTDHVNITPTVAERYATVTVNGEPITQTFTPGLPGFPGTPPMPPMGGFPGFPGIPATPGTPDTITGAQSSNIPLVVGPNVINVVVTAKDGETINNYVITVTRQASSNVYLSDLTTSEGSLYPEFEPTGPNYFFTVNSDVESIKFTPTLEDSNASITIDGTATNSGEESLPLDLHLGENYFTIEVTAEDGVTTRSTLISVTRISNNADLGYLEISNGALSPEFNSATASYIASVAYDVTGINVTPTVAYYNSTVSVNGAPVVGDNSASVLRGVSPSVNVTLEVGSNIIDVVVTAGDGTNKTYTINVTREALPIPSDISNLVETHTTTTADFTFTLPSDLDFTTVNIYMDGNAVDSVTSGVYNVQGLTPNTSYTFLFQAVNRAGTASVGVTHTFKTNDVVKPPVEPPVNPPVIVPTATPTATIAPTATPTPTPVVTATPTPVPTQDTPKLNDKVSVVVIRAIIAKAENTPSKKFSDVPANSWSAATIDLATRMGIVTGDTDGSFNPTKPTTRAEFATMLVNALGLKSSGTDGFTDVQGNWAANAINALKSNGIISGYGDGSFKPDQTISRAEIVTMIARIMTTGKVTTGKQFTDIKGNWAQDAINQAADAGIVSGNGDGKFDPNTNATREQSLAMILRMLNVTLDLGLKL